MKQYKHREYKYIVEAEMTSQGFYHVRGYRCSNVNPCIQRDAGVSLAVKDFYSLFEAIEQAERCPSCGSEYHVKVHRSSGRVCVRCHNCGLRGPTSSFALRGPDSTFSKECEITAIRMWNRLYMEEEGGTTEG